MAVDETYLAEILEKLQHIEGTSHKKMFGGVGFFNQSKMFGMISEDVFRLKADETTIPDFESYGMGPLVMKTKNRSMPYWQVPEAVLNDQKQLTDWVQKAIAIAIK